MSDLLRMTGMYSGMDTESIVSQLVQVKSQKVTKLKNEQTKLEWKQEAWQEMNKKLYSLYSSTLSDLRFSSAYKKKSTVSSDTTKATVVASESAVNGTQTLKIKHLAKSGYLTGAELKQKEVAETKDGVTKTKKVDWTTDDKLADIDSSMVGKKITISVGTGDEKKETSIEITEEMKISDFVGKLKEAGVNASFDTTNQRFFISSTSTGLKNEFSLSSDNLDSGDSVLKALGIDANATYADGAKCTRIAAQDAVIELNGAEFKSDTNTFSINGLTINAVGETEEEISIVTSTDYDGIYDTIKDFITEYNEIINEVNKKYNADSARKYDVLSDEEKEAMTDEQIENWEGKIKDSLLRKDNDLYAIMNALKSSMSEGVEVNGKTMYLFDFGVETLSYFEAEEDERNAYHILGDKEDDKVSGKDDKLKKAIASDPDTVAEFFSGLCKKMYTKLDDIMEMTDYRSIYKVYDDKRLKKEYDDYTKKIKEAEDKLNDYEDKWYDKFAAMEVALSKLQSNSNAVTSMLGGM
ncbi:MAG: flagellar filament capping protein FliD [Lachnospiraceae bacterium]|nr:flagellar filament capping protein FliD [Lachnospiraceae bacterium]